MDINRSAKILRKELVKEGVNIKHTKLLEMVSKSLGYDNYDATKELEYTASATFEKIEFNFHGFHCVKAKTFDEAYEIYQHELSHAGLFLIGENSEGEVRIDKPGWVIPLEDVFYNQPVLEIMEIPE